MKAFLFSNIMTARNDGAQGIRKKPRMDAEERGWTLTGDRFGRRAKINEVLRMPLKGSAQALLFSATVLQASAEGARS